MRHRPFVLAIGGGFMLMSTLGTQTVSRTALLVRLLMIAGTARPCSKIHQNSIITLTASRSFIAR